MIEPVKLPHRGSGCGFIVAKRLARLVGVGRLERGIRCGVRIARFQKIFPFVEILKRRFQIRCLCRIGHSFQYVTGRCQTNEPYPVRRPSDSQVNSSRSIAHRLLSRSNRAYPVTGQGRGLQRNSPAALTASVFADRFPGCCQPAAEDQTPGDEKRGDLSNLATRWNRFLI